MQITNAELIKDFVFPFYSNGIDPVELDEVEKFFYDSLPDFDDSGAETALKTYSKYASRIAALHTEYVGMVDSVKVDDCGFLEAQNNLADALKLLCGESVPTQDLLAAIYRFGCKCDHSLAEAAETYQAYFQRLERIKSSFVELYV